MERTQEYGSLAKALVGFQADMENVTKDATNPFYKSRYATLEAILTAAKPHLKKHGLAVVQMPDGEGLTTCIVHESGQSIQANAKLVLKDQTPQGQGSAITYMRRYALSAALGIATEDDDDGNEASKPPQSRQAAPQRAQAPKPTKDPAVELKAQKDRVLSLLKLHKVPCATKNECSASVFTLTGLHLEDKNLEAIAETLSDLLEAKDAQ